MKKMAKIPNIEGSENMNTIQNIKKRGRDKDTKYFKRTACRSVKKQPQCKK
jgi:hypothetical protein